MGFPNEKTKAPDSKVHNIDFPPRGKRSTPAGTTLLVVLRLADVALQYMILSRWGPLLINLLGGQITEIAQNNTTGDFLGLQPYYPNGDHFYWDHPLNLKFCLPSLPSL